MKYIYRVIIICLICAYNINTNAQITAFETRYEYLAYPDTVVIGAKFTDITGDYYTVEAFKVDNNYYISLRNVDNQLVPNTNGEINYQITDSRFDNLQMLMELNLHILH